MSEFSKQIADEIDNLARLAGRAATTLRTKPDATSLAQRARLLRDVDKMRSRLEKHIEALERTPHA